MQSSFSVTSSVCILKTLELNFKLGNSTLLGRERLGAFLIHSKVRPSHGRWQRKDWDVSKHSWRVALRQKHLILPSGIVVVGGDGWGSTARNFITSNAVHFTRQPLLHRRVCLIGTCHILAIFFHRFVDGGFFGRLFLSSGFFFFFFSLGCQSNLVFQNANTIGPAGNRLNNFYA